MTLTTPAVATALVAVGIVGALALVVRLTQRLPDAPHPFRPPELAFLRPEDVEAELARAA